MGVDQNPVGLGWATFSLSSPEVCANVEAGRVETNRASVYDTTQTGVIGVVELLASEIWP